VNHNPTTHSHGHHCLITTGGGETFAILALPRLVTIAIRLSCPTSLPRCLAGTTRVRSHACGGNELWWKRTFVTTRVRKLYSVITKLVFCGLEQLPAALETRVRTTCEPHIFLKFFSVFPSFCAPRPDPNARASTKIVPRASCLLCSTAMQAFDPLIGAKTLARTLFVMDKPDRNDVGSR